jgi:hypothetical protein
MTAKLLAAFLLGAGETASIFGIIYGSTKTPLYVMSVLGVTFFSMIIFYIVINWFMKNWKK